MVAYFNSIKVQLERQTSLGLSGVDIFQFHKGTIRTDFEDNLYNFLFQFQFHKGTIRTFSAVIQYDAFANFNSIKVQLEHC